LTSVHERTLARPAGQIERLTRCDAGYAIPRENLKLKEASDCHIVVRAEVVEGWVIISQLGDDI